MVVPIAFDECLEVVVLIYNLVLSLVEPWLAFALRFAGHDELQSRRDAS